MQRSCAVNRRRNCLRPLTAAHAQHRQQHEQVTLNVINRISQSERERALNAVDQKEAKQSVLLHLNHMKSIINNALDIINMPRELIERAK